MTRPTNFRPCPPALLPDRHPLAQAARLVEVPAPPLPRSVPTLTVYPDGFVNANAEASGLLAGFPGICLRPPPAVRAGRQPQLWELGPGECTDLNPRADKLSQLRFRLDPATAPPPARYLLLPVAGAANRFTLMPG